MGGHMRTSFVRRGVAAALLLSAVAFAPVAHAASPGPGPTTAVLPVPEPRIIPGNPALAPPTPYTLVLGSLEARDTEEGPGDEIRVKVKERGGDNSYYHVWPFNDSEMDTEAPTCWVWTSANADCLPGSRPRAAGPYLQLYLDPGAVFDIEVWDDDTIGDDLLMSIRVTVPDAPQRIVGESPAGKNHYYRLVADIERA